MPDPRRDLPRPEFARCVPMRLDMRMRTAARLGIPLAMSAVLCLGCSADEPSKPEHSPTGTPTTGTPTPAKTVTVSPRPQSAAKLKVTIAGEGLSAAEKSEVRKGVARAVGSWFENAYLAGPLPRDAQAPYPHAFESFTAGAKKSAADRANVMTGARYGPKLTDLTPTRESAEVRVWQHGGKPGGATAKVKLVAEGEAKGGGHRTIEVSGTLQLTPAGERWKIFGFDIDAGTA